MKLHIKFGFDWPSVFWEERLKNVGDEWMDGRARLYYKLTYEPKGSGELKKKKKDRNKQKHTKYQI